VTGKSSSLSHESRLNLGFIFAGNQGTGFQDRKTVHRALKVCYIPLFRKTGRNKRIKNLLFSRVSCAGIFRVYKTMIPWEILFPDAFVKTKFPGRKLVNTGGFQGR